MEVRKLTTKIMVRSTIGIEGEKKKFSIKILPIFVTICLICNQIFQFAVNVPCSAFPPSAEYLNFICQQTCVIVDNITLELSNLLKKRKKELFVSS